MAPGSIEGQELGKHAARTFNQAVLAAVRMARHSRKLLDSFHAHLRTLHEVLAFYHVAGAEDFLVHVGVLDSQHMRDFNLTAFTERPEVAHIQTHLIFEFQRNTDLANLPPR